MDSKFAKGNNLYKLFWLFLIGSVVGDVLETVYCRFSMGFWMNRSSVIYGPFSIVWGLGAVVLTLCLQRLKHRGDLAVFLGGALVGGFYEYLCSIFTEKVLGTTFWSYQKLPFNLNGRVNLIFCCFWGLLALVWVRKVYPGLSGKIESIPAKVGRPLTWFLLLFMALNMFLSASAIIRTVERRYRVPQKTRYQKFLDEYYPDERILRHYPNMKFV